MIKFKITVLKKHYNNELAEEYCFDYAKPCELFEVGQEIIFKHGEKPAGFCDWAWNDIHKSMEILAQDGALKTWMKKNNVIIACCTDGIRPVVFKIELF